jgi:uncharacterized membrane protein HdeD (DUF308 family)
MEHRGLLALMGVISAVAGVLLVRHPIAGVVAIALLLGLWLISFGIVRLIEAFDDEEHRVWSVLLALVEIAAGIVIVAVPDIGVGALALLTGLAFIFRGLAMCGLGWALRGARQQTA